MAQRRTTIADIARRAGVSVGTVSNVFNGKGRFTPSTRERVLQAAAELHFTPNALIRSLQTGKTYVIGVFTWPITSGITQDFNLLLLKGILSGLAAVRYDALLYSRHPHESDVPVTMFLDSRVDGVIIAPGGLSSDDLETLAGSGLPVVALYQSPVPARMGAVNIDNLAGLGAAMDHLVRLGHRRIAFYAPLFAHDYTERLLGYRLGLERHSIPFDPALQIVPEGDYREEIGAACDRLLALADPPTALIAGNDSIALIFLREFAQRGVRVPKDISLVGFDDVPVASEPPGLTTIRQPVEEVGCIAATLAHRMICGHPADECRAVLPVELVVRGTTAPPPPARE
jgi:LacI family transcriptional regulator